MTSRSSNSASALRRPLAPMDVRRSPSSASSHDALRQGVDIVERDEEAGSPVLHRLTTPADIGGDDRKSTGRRPPSPIVGTLRGRTAAGTCRSRSRAH